MKKVISVFLTVILVACLFTACGGSDYAKGEWVFSRVVGVELKEEVATSPGYESYLNELYTEYNASNEEELEAAMLAEIIENGDFTPCYINFKSDRVAFYDVIMEREATYVYYETGENEGFFSVYTELDPADGNPDPLTNPPLVYNPETKTITVSLGYGAVVAILEYVAK